MKTKTKTKTKTKAKSKVKKASTKKPTSPKKPTFHLLSDLHWEFHTDYGEEFCASLPKVKADYLILAGDIGLLYDYDRIYHTLQKLCKRYKEVFWVFGNHEYYGFRMSDLKEVLEANNIKNLHILNNEVYQLPNGYQVVGTTLWFPDQPGNEALSHMLNDFRLIEGFEQWVYETHEKNKEWLRQVCNDKTILITHHLPTQQSVAARYKLHMLNRFYVGDIQDILVNKEVPLAVHGHSHGSIEYTVHKTKVVCNAYGYRHHETNPNFNPGLVLTV